VGPIGPIVIRRDASEPKREREGDMGCKKVLAFGQKSVCGVFFPRPEFAYGVVHQR
jgi:hypothetical protein